MIVVQQILLTFLLFGHRRQKLLPNRAQNSGRSLWQQGLHIQYRSYRYSPRQLLGAFSLKAKIAELFGAFSTL